MDRDNEKPSRNVQVHAFEAQGRPITNEEVSSGDGYLLIVRCTPILIIIVQYAQYLQAVKGPRIPASWAQVSPATATNGQVNGVAKTNGASLNGHSHTNGHSVDTTSLSYAFLEDKAVRTVYGMVPLKYALDWPVFASYDELAGCASWMGGRIPTFEEARSLYEHVRRLEKEQAEKKLGKTVPAVNGYVSLCPIRGMCY